MEKDFAQQADLDFHCAAESADERHQAMRDALQKRLERLKRKTAG
jgi:hypothetical protein